jgi:hypothetical protein
MSDIRSVVHVRLKKFFFQKEPKRFQAIRSCKANFKSPLSGEKMWSLLLLALSLSPKHVSAENVPQCLSETVTVAEQINLFPEDEHGNYRTAQLLLVWRIFETGCERKPARGDGGRSCGPLQTGEIARRGISCDALEADATLGVQIGAEYMQRLLQTFDGRLHLALQAYAAGMQYKSAKAFRIVENRCALIGGCE